MERMSEQQHDAWEERIRDTARAFPYPPTPDLASRAARHPGIAARSERFPRRRLAQLVAVALLILAALMAVPPVRAAVFDALRIGAVRIIPVQPTASTVLSSATKVSRPAATPSLTSIGSVFDLPGETTLADARRQASFPVRLPTYPRGLGPPDRVFVEDFGGPVVALVWTRPGRPDRARLALYELPSGSVVEKKLAPISHIQQTTVNGERAVWATGPHLLRVLTNGRVALQRQVDTDVLIWTRDGVTYRLETVLPLPEARKIAESLR
jgi:hypothetical protein